MDQLKKNRTTAKRLFTRANNAVHNSVKLNDSWELVSKKFVDLEKRYNDVQEKHEIYLVELEEDSEFDATELNAWMDEIQAEFDETERQSHKYIKHSKQITESQSDKTVEKDTQSMKSKIFTENENTTILDNLKKPNCKMKQKRLKI